MRLDVNLASRPYEDTRQFWLRWGTGLALVIIVTLALLSETAIGWYYARQDRQMISKIRAQIASRDQERSLAEAFLNKPENRSVRDRSQFLNELIERKAFSWTQIFAELERVMPKNLHVVSIHPELDDNNELEIKLVVAGESADRAIELVRNMEKSARFRQPQITTQNTQTASQNPGDKVEFGITAGYVPATPREGAQVETTAENRP
jgi:type IV pilus assembly protein PilN